MRCIGMVHVSYRQTSGLQWICSACRSIVQFAYGEDGIDVMNVSYLKELGFLARNAERFAQQLNLQQALQTSGLSKWEEEARSLTRYDLLIDTILRT